MKKQSKITNLLVVPLIATAVFLGSPALAANASHPSSPIEVRHKTTKESMPNGKGGIAGIVTSINGTIIVVNTKNNTQYTVDASHATIMKASLEPNVNPALVTIANIQVGDTIFVRGTISDKEVNAENIFDGKMLGRGKLEKLGKLKHFLRKHS